MDARCFFLIFLVLLIGVARCENEVENIEDSETDQFTCPRFHGNFPHPDDCSKYYFCTFFIRSLRTCPSSELFDNGKKECRREDVHCGSRKRPNGDDDPITTLPTTKKEEKDQFTCPRFYGNFPHPDDCSKYYFCSFYRKSLITCPSSELFDNEKKECRRGEDVHCGSRNRPNGDDDPTTSLPTTKKDEEEQFTCPIFKGNHPHPDDCSKYYFCSFFIKSLRTCPSSELFDNEKKECRRGDDVHCGSRKRPNGDDDPATTLPTTKKEEKDRFTCPRFHGNFPHADDCSKFYFCSFYLKSLRTCPTSQLFDNEKKECRRGEDVNCGSRKRPNDATTEEITTTPIPTETPTPTEPETTTPTEPETKTPAEPETKTSIEPETTTSTEPETTTSTEPETTTQTEPETTTPTPTEPEPTTTTTTEEPTTTKRPKVTAPDTDCDEDDVDCIIDDLGKKPDWFVCPDDIGSYPHPSSKRLFIFCLNWKPSVKKCAQDFVFSEDLRSCVRRN